MENANSYDFEKRSVRMLSLTQQMHVPHLQ